MADGRPVKAASGAGFTPARLQKFVYKGLGPVNPDQRVPWPTAKDQNRYFLTYLLRAFGPTSAP